MRDAVSQEIAERTRHHQARIARLKTSAANLRATGAPAAPMPLVMLPHGDSWFDYPLSGNSLSLRTTDIIAQLEMMGSISPSSSTCPITATQQRTRWRGPSRKG